jgi:hypothetical protein
MYVSFGGKWVKVEDSCMISCEHVLICVIFFLTFIASCDNPRVLYFYYSFTMSFIGTMDKRECLFYRRPNCVEH